MNFIVISVILSLLNFLANSVNSEKILGLFPHPGYSHFRSFYPVMYGLAERGHDVTIVTYFPSKNTHNNYKEIILKGSYPLNEYDLDVVSPGKPIYKAVKEAMFLIDLGTSACEVFYESNATTTIQKSHAVKPFDVVIIESFNTDCMFGLTHLLEVPVVALSSCSLMPWHYERVGLPIFPSYIVSQYAGYSEPMNYFERLQSFLATHIIKYLYRFVAESRDNEIIRKYIKNDVDVHELAKSTRLLMVNQHYSLSGPKPLSPQVIEIGGVHMWEKFEELPKDLSNFLNASEHGVVFISWGSLVKASSISKNRLNAMVNALKKIPQRIVWKWDGKQLPVKDEKFFISKWILQREVLCHPKVKLFWSHGGLLGVSESTYCGVPMVITPMYGDQYLNAKAAEKRKTGKILMYDDINEDNVYNTISEVLHQSYSSNAKYVSNVYRNRQNTPLETAFWWIEHVLETKGNNLTYSSSVDMNWFVYYSYDAILTLAVAFIIGITALVCCTKYFYRCCCAPSSQHLKSKTS